MTGARIFSIGRAGSFRSELGASCALLLGLPGVASAQDVNYAEMEELFGEPVTTSVTGKPQRASEAPAALVIITRDEIRRSPAHDIPGLLQAHAGIDVARWTAQGTDVAIRGGVQPFNPRLLVLVNGRQVYLDHYGMTNWAGIGVQLEEIQQIEVVKGPNSALFGFNAVSGVINIITIDPLQTQRVAVTGGVDTVGQHFAKGVASIKLSPAVGLRLSGGYTSARELEGLAASVLAPPPSPTPFQPWHAEAAAELYARLGERTQGGISFTHTRTQQFEVTPVLSTNPGRYRFTSIGARISHDTGWGVLSARLLQNTSHIEVGGIGPGPLPVTLSFDNKVRVASADALVRAGTANTLRFGIEYRSNALRSSPGYPGATHYDVYAASGMWEAKLSDAVTLTTAGRIDHLQLEQQGVVDQPSLFTKSDYDRSITEWSFNGALLVKLRENDTLRLAASKGVQVPSLYNLGARLVFDIPGVPVPVVSSGDPYIHPAIVWSGEIGLTRLFGTNGTRVEIVGFYNRTTDVIAPDGAQAVPRATPPAFPFILGSSVNVGSVEAYGLEASAGGRFSPAWTWSLNYTWTHVQQRIASNANGVFQRPLALDSATPEHKVKAQVSYEQGPWLATAAARYTSATRQLVATAPYQAGPLALFDVDDNLAIDAKVALQVNDRLRVSISGENLTGAGGAYLSPAPAERRLRAGFEVTF